MIWFFLAVIVALAVFSAGFRKVLGYTAAGIGAALVLFFVIAMAMHG